MILQSSDLVPFLCRATGKCCIHNVVLLSSFDIFSIAKNLDLPASELFEKKILTYRINPANFWMEPILNSRSNSTCPFLFRDSDGANEQYLCEIYESRPLVCRVYPLKYDKEESRFMRFFPAENRCYECISPESKLTLGEYLDASNVNVLMGEFKRYLTLIDKISLEGMNLERIKKNKLAQKKFFEIQKILYETYPQKDNLQGALPFEEMESRVDDILNKSDLV